MPALREALRNLSDDVFFDLLEDDEEYLVLLDLPGVEPTTIEVYIDGGTVSIKGVRPFPGEDFEYVEQNRDPHVEIDIPMPTGVDTDRIRWEFDCGVLEMHLPKRSAS